MKNKIINLVAKGEVNEAINQVEHFLEELKDEYFEWIALKSRYSELTKNNSKGVITQAEYTLGLNKINSLILNYNKRLDSIVNKSFEEKTSFAISQEGYIERLQNQISSQYTIVEKLGEGASTIVFKAKELLGNKFVTIKALKNQNLIQDSLAFDEINKVKNFKHRNIRTILDASNFKEYPKYIILEYIDGTDIQEIVEKSGARTLHETKKILLKISDALYYLHKRKIFSSDLRASRIMIDEEGEPILSPFSVFKTRTELSYLQIISDFRYMSPERLVSKNNILSGSPKSNQFSLGVLAYYLLTGEPLFSGDSLLSIIEDRKKFNTNKEYRAKKLKKLRSSNELTDFVIRLLSQKKEDRYDNVKKVIDTINKIKINTNLHCEIANESYQRSIAYAPDFIGLFYKELFEKLPIAKQRILEANIDIKRLKIMLHNSINLMIETNVDDSYIEKIKKIKGHKGLKIEDYQVFFDVFISLIKESDYLWSDTIQEAWNQTISEAIMDLSKK